MFAGQVVEKLSISSLLIIITCKDPTWMLTEQNFTKVSLAWTSTKQPTQSYAGKEFCCKNHASANLSPIN